MVKDIYFNLLGYTGSSVSLRGVSDPKMFDSQGIEGLMAYSKLLRVRTNGEKKNIRDFPY